MKKQTASDKIEIFERKSPPRAIAAMAVPTILSQIITIIYSLADTFFVGHTGDPYQVAALSLSFHFYMILTCIGNLFGIGANSRISRFLGEGKRQSAEETSSFALWGSLAVTAVILAALAVFLKPLLSLFGASENTVGHAVRYLTWTLLIGGLPTEASIMLGHMLRAEGNAQAASRGTILGGVLNLLLDPLFIFTFGMGAAGAGFATMLANIVSLVYFILVLRREGKETVIRPAFRLFNFHHASDVLLVGLPAAMTIALATTANLLLTKLMSAYGDISIAAYGVTQKLGSIIVNINLGLTQGIMPLIGYSYAANNPQRVRSICRWSFLILICFVAVFLSVFRLFPVTLMQLFLTDAETISIGAAFLKVWCICIPGLTFTFLISSVFQAMGLWKRSTLLSILRQVMLFIPAMLILNHLFGVNGLVFSQPTSDTMTALIAIGLYIGVSGKLRNAEKQEPEA